MQTHAPGRGDAEALEVLGVEEGEHDHLLERRDVALEPADGVPVDGRVDLHGHGVRAACVCVFKCVFMCVWCVFV